MPYRLSHPPALFHSGYFGNRFWLFAQASLDCSLSILSFPMSLGYRIIGVTVKDACMYRRWQTHTHHNLHTHKHTMLAFCHCDKMSERNNLKEEGFILAFISGGFSPWSFRFTPSFLGHGKAEHYGGE
jgi:hypothetical protein